MVFYRTFASHDYLFFVAALEDLVSIIFPTTCSNKKVCEISFPKRID